MKRTTALILGAACPLALIPLAGALEVDKAAAQAVAEKSSNPLADLVAWITLLDAWGLIGLAIIIGSVAVTIWKLNSGATPFRLGDTLIDPMTNKGSLLRLGFFIGLIGAWAVAFFYMLKGDDVKQFVLGLLAIFVTPVITNRAMEIWDPRTKAAAYNTAPGMPAEPPPPQPVAGDVTIKTEVNKP